MDAILIGLLIPFAGTALGSAFVFFMKKEMPALLQKALLGFASGVMVAASVWSLLIPGMEMSGGSVWPVTIGLLGGFAFLLLIDQLTPHLHVTGEAEGPKSHLSKTTMLALAVTIHNLPEGMAVGVALAGAMNPPPAPWPCRWVSPSRTRRKEPSSRCPSGRRETPAGSPS